jgi:lipoprotein-releasing system permease protein
MFEDVLKIVDSTIGYILPAAQLIGVIVASILLTAVLVGAFVRILKHVSERGHVKSWKLMLALRFLLGFKEEKLTWFRRLIPVAGQNFIAMTGTAIGVWALIVVLSVMSGFENDLKEKIIRYNPHITIERCAQAANDFEDAGNCADLVEKIRKIDGITQAESYIHGEAMIASSTNMGPGTTVRGIEEGGALEQFWLGDSTTAGARNAIAHPELVMSDRDLGFKSAAAAADETAPDAETAAADETAEPAGMAGTAAEAAPEAAAEAAPEAAATVKTVNVPSIIESTDQVRIRPGILLGIELARSLGVADGDEVMVIVPDGDVGPTGVKPATRTFRVAGTFMSGLYEYDLKTAFVLKDEGKNLFFTSNPERIAMMVSDMNRLDQIAEAVGGVVTDIPAARVRTVAQTNRSLFSALMVERIAMFLVLGLVILVAAFNVFGSLLLITMEKTRDIAVLRSMGVTRGGIRAVYFMIGSTIGLTGTISGVLLGLGTCFYIKTAGIKLPSEYYLDRLPVSVSSLDVILVAVAALGAALIATIYPTSAVASVSPSDGLRND